MVYGTWIIFLLNLLIRAVIIGIIVLLIKALRKYLKSDETRQEQKIIRRSLAEVLKSHRTRCKMTQEFVAEALGISWQAVSKWESGVSEPSTSHLIALANLYGVKPEDILREVKL